VWNLPSDPDASYSATGPLRRGRVNMTHGAYRRRKRFTYGRFAAHLARMAEACHRDAGPACPLGLVAVVRYT